MSSVGCTMPRRAPIFAVCCGHHGQTIPYPSNCSKIEYGKNRIAEAINSHYPLSKKFDTTFEIQGEPSNFCLLFKEKRQNHVSKNLLGVTRVLSVIVIVRAGRVVRSPRPPFRPEHKRTMGARGETNNLNGPFLRYAQRTSRIFPPIPPPQRRSVSRRSNQKPSVAPTKAFVPTLIAISSYVSPFLL